MVFAAICAAGAFFVASQACAAVMRATLYFDEDLSPLHDLGFAVLPDWSESLTVVVVCHVWGLTLLAASVLLMVRCHAPESPALRVVRFLTVSGLSTCASLVCQAVTQLPDPSRHWTEHYPLMYPVIFTSAVWHVWWYKQSWHWSRMAIAFFAVLGAALLIASHCYYTVDVLCMILVTTAIFLSYVKRTASPRAVANLGAVAAWLEQRSARDRASTTVRELETSTFSSDEVKIARHVHESLSEFDKRFLPVAHATAILGGSFAAMILNLTSASITNALRPTNREPMPDLIQRVLGDSDQWMSLNTANVLIFAAVGLAVVDIALFNPLPLVTLRRSTTIFTLAFTARSITVISTINVDPFADCHRRYHPDAATCGDDIFSGHTVTVMTSMFALVMFRESRLLKLLCGLYVVVTLFCIIATKFHYSRDVLTAALAFQAAKMILYAFAAEQHSVMATSTARLQYEADFYIARGRVMFGWGRLSLPQHETAASPVFAPSSLRELFTLRSIFQQVRPTYRQPTRFQRLLGSRVAGTA
jgi:hypothetical protein